MQSDTTLLDDGLMESLDVRGSAGSSEVAMFTDVVTDADDTRVALRCTEGSDEHFALDDVKITAVEVGTVAG